MTERPKCNAVTNQEATDTLLANKKCWTSAQVQQDRLVAADTAAAAEVENATISAQKKYRVAAFKDQLHKENQQCEKNMAHPDLAQAAHRVCAK